MLRENTGPHEKIYVYFNPNSFLWMSSQFFGLYPCSETLLFPGIFRSWISSSLKYEEVPEEEICRKLQLSVNSSFHRWRCSSRREKIELQNFQSPYNRVDCSDQALEIFSRLSLKSLIFEEYCPWMCFRYFRQSFLIFVSNASHVHKS